MWLQLGHYQDTIGTLSDTIKKSLKINKLALNWRYIFVGALYYE